MRVVYVKLMLCGMLVMMAPVFSGCVGLVVGGAAAATTYAVTQDFVTTSVDVGFHDAMRAVREYIAQIGEIDDSHEKIGEIKAMVEGATVRVIVSKLTERTVDIKVAARDTVMPRTDLARAILSGILREL